MVAAGFPVPPLCRRKGSAGDVGVTRGFTPLPQNARSKRTVPLLRPSYPAPVALPVAARGGATADRVWGRFPGAGRPAPWRPSPRPPPRGRRRAGAGSDGRGARGGLAPAGGSSPALPAEDGGAARVLFVRR